MIRGILRDAGVGHAPAERSGGEAALATDVDIGVDALEALQHLVAAGYTFVWHPEQHPLNRGDELYGLPVAPITE